MNLSEEPRGGNSASRGRRAAGEHRALFAPMASDGIGWLRIAEPQRDARAACMSIAAYIHLLRPGASLSDLQARAESSVRELESGAASVTVIDCMHRVDRIALGADV